MTEVLNYSFNAIILMLLIVYILIYSCSGKVEFSDFVNFCWFREQNNF